MNTGTPNLDAMSESELWAFWKTHQHPKPALARQMFPGAKSGHVRALRDLANYAANKATAMQCRLRSDIDTAWTYEHICDAIYRQLPTWAQW